MFPQHFILYINIHYQEGHRFPMLKYSASQQLLHEGTFQSDFFQPGICDLNHVLAIHKQEYVNDLLNLTLNTRAAENWISLSKNL
jgi:acetoin utilization deacetylase AcuC-like enzyme